MHRSEDRPCIAARPRPPILIILIKGNPLYPHRAQDLSSGRGKGGEDGSTAHYRRDFTLKSALSLHLQVLDYGSPIVYNFKYL